MRVPSFKTKKIGKDIQKMIDMAPTRGMYKIVLQSLDAGMDELVELRQAIPSDDETIQEILEAWDTAFTQFGEREASYFAAFMESESREVVDAPLFDADYDGFDFDPEPDWPDIETPWRLANELSTAAALAGADQDFLDGIEARFRSLITSFWERANALIVIERTEFEEQVASESHAPQEGAGRGYGFLPLLAVGAVALVGALGMAAGYSASQSASSDQYVESTPLEKHMKLAKTVGIGVLIGVAVAVLLILRVRR